MSEPKFRAVPPVVLAILLWSSLGHTQSYKDAESALRAAEQSVAIAASLGPSIIKDQEEVERLTKTLPSQHAALSALLKLEAKALEELRAGEYCSRCERSKTEIEDGGEDFASHLASVGGERLQSAPQAVQDKVKDRFAKQASELRDAIKKTGSAIAAARKRIGEQTKQFTKETVASRKAYRDAFSLAEGAADAAKKLLQRQVQEAKKNLSTFDRTVEGTTPKLDAATYNQLRSTLAKQVQDLKTRLDEHQTESGIYSSAIRERFDETGYKLNQFARKIGGVPYLGLPWVAPRARPPKFETDPLGLTDVNIPVGSDEVSVSGSHGLLGGALKLEIDDFNMTQRISACLEVAQYGICARRTTSFSGGVTTTDSVDVTTPVDYRPTIKAMRDLVKEDAAQPTRRPKENPQQPVRGPVLP